MSGYLLFFRAQDPTARPDWLRRVMPSTGCLPQGKDGSVNLAYACCARCPYCSSSPLDAHITHPQDPALGKPEGGKGHSPGVGRHEHTPRALR